MKLLVVSNMYPNKKYPHCGTFVKNFCNQLNYLNIKYEKSVLYMKPNKLSKLWGYAIFYGNTLFKLVFKRYDIIYVHYASHSGIPVLLANKFKKLIIYTNVHGSDVVPENKKQEKFQPYTRKILKLSKKIIVPSKYFEDYICNKYLIEKENIYIYPSAGVNTKIFFPYTESKKDLIRNSLNLSPQYTYVGYIGRISNGKGWKTFIESIHYIKKSIDNMRFIIVGTGPEESELEKLIIKYSLEKWIIRFQLLPQIKLADIYNILNIFVFPTEREGESLGLVSLEAMACSVPILSSNFAAPKYYVIDEYNGYQFEKGDCKDLANKLLKIHHYENKEALKKGAFMTSKQYSIENSIVLLKKIFYSDLE